MTNLSERNTTQETDILILGSGLVGITLALTLQRWKAPYHITLLDPKAPDSNTNDPRTLALSHGTRQILNTLGLWFPHTSTPIHDIHVSQANSFGRTLITREEQQLPALGYVTTYKQLHHTLSSALQVGTTLTQCYGYTAEHITNNENDITLSACNSEHCTQIRAKLIIHAEGSSDDTNAVHVRDYQQHAILAEVIAAPAYPHRAWERFTPSGPIALLPLREKHALIFTSPPATVDQLMQLDDSQFLEILQQQFAHRLQFNALSTRTRQPLSLRLRRTLQAPRQLWIGNAAQTLHPVSGQGFNLGIRDATELAQMLITQASTDAGNPKLLSSYVRKRQLDRQGSTYFTDSLVRLFSNNTPPLRMARGLALCAIDLCPPIRKFITQRMIWGTRHL